LSQKCKKDNFSCPVLQQYVDDRERIITDISSECKVSRSDVKSLFIRILNGGSFTAWAKELAIQNKAPKFVSQFITEISLLQDNFWTKYTHLQRTCKKKDAPKATLLARVLNTEENNLLAHIVWFEEKRHQRTSMSSSLTVVRSGVIH
jgi:hypothetical protein